MSLPNPRSPARALRLDPRDVARRVLVVITASAGLAGILAGRSLLAVLLRAGAVCCAGVLLIACTEALVRRAKRRVVQ